MLWSHRFVRRGITAVAAAGTIGYLGYSEFVRLPPVQVLGDLDLGAQPAWEPIQAQFTLSNTSTEPVVLERLDKF